MKGRFALIANLLRENDRRNEIIFAKFDPITGEGSVGKRVRVEIPDFVVPVQWLPERMMQVEFVRRLVEAGSIERFLLTCLAWSLTRLTLQRFLINS